MLTPQSTRLLDAEQIRDAADILDIARTYLHLRRSGKNWVASCPLKKEKTPSFYIYPTAGDQHYHCYSCCAHGDVISLVMEMERITFPEALRLLADRYGIQSTRDARPVVTSRVATELAARAAEFVAGLTAMRAQLCRHGDIPVADVIYRLVVELCDDPLPAAERAIAMYRQALDEDATATRRVVSMGRDNIADQRQCASAMVDLLATRQQIDSEVAA